MSSDNRAIRRTTELLRLCHDLRQCVAAGLMLSTSVDDVPDADLRHRLDLINQTMEQASRLLESAFCDLAPKPWSLDLGALVKECADVARMHHGIDIDVEDTGSSPVHGDPVQIRRAVDNILDNASRAVGEDGHIKIRLGSEQDMAWLEVSDDGPGFGRIPHGTGHGLSIVRSAVRASGGRVDIDSGPGSGTSVRMFLPSQRSGELR